MQVFAEDLAVAVAVRRRGVGELEAQGEARLAEQADERVAHGGGDALEAEVQWAARLGGRCGGGRRRARPRCEGQFQVRCQHVVVAL
jgi:hypothetical protein